MRIAVLGLFNSGSTALAGVLHRLGVNMGGPPFHMQFYEPEDLAAKLRLWWSEPELVESAGLDERVRFLTEWIERKEREGFTEIGIKHPLLCLSALDVEKAWGPGVCYIWSKRDLIDSIGGLERRHWYANPAAMQLRLWDALIDFVATRQHLRVSYTELVGNPHRTIEQLVQELGLTVSDRKIERAAMTIRRPFKS